MALLNWSDRYRTGVKQIDAEHRNLFTLFNSLHKAVERGIDDREAGQAIGGLVAYVRSHFEHEERLMAGCGFPQFEEHSQLHRELMKTVYAIHRVHMKMPTEVDPERLIGFVRTWLSQHILGSDMRYVPFVLGAATGEEPVPDLALVSEPDEEGLVPVTVRVPSGRIELVERCATVLAGGGPQVDALAEAVDPAMDMPLDEARELVQRALW